MTETPVTPWSYISNAGAAAIGARLRRISERIDRDAARVYADADVRFEQRWFGVLSLLSLFGPQPVGDLASALGVSHASVSQVRKALAEAGLITWDPDPTDGRQRTLRLSADGEVLVERLAPIWRALAQAAIELDAEAHEVLAALDRLETALKRESLYERARALLE